MCSIPHLEPECAPLSRMLDGQVLRPWAHFELPDNDYIVGGRRDPVMPGPSGVVEPLDPVTKVGAWEECCTPVLVWDGARTHPTVSRCSRPQHPAHKLQCHVASPCLCVSQHSRSFLPQAGGSMPLRFARGVMARKKAPPLACLQVLEIESLGINLRNVKRFMVLNPTCIG